MKKIYYSFIPFILYTLTSLLHSNNAYARSLQQTADKLGQLLTKISLSVSIAAIMICALCFYLGKTDALERFGKVLGGIFITVSAVTIVNFFQSVA